MQQRRAEYRLTMGVRLGSEARRTNVQLRPKRCLAHCLLEVPVSYARRSCRGISSAAGLLLCAILTSLPGIAQRSVLDSVPSLETVRSRLELTPEQEAQLRPIFQNRLSELQQSQLLLQRASTPQKKDDVLRDEKRASDAFNSLVESVLTPSQKTEWREMRSAVREKIEERNE